MVDFESTVLSHTHLPGAVSLHCKEKALESTAGMTSSERNVLMKIATMERATKRDKKGQKAVLVWNYINCQGRSRAASLQTQSGHLHTWLSFKLFVIVHLTHTHYFLAFMVSQRKASCPIAKATQKYTKSNINVNVDVSHFRSWRVS